jgi:hypothetical protein
MSESDTLAVRTGLREQHATPLNELPEWCPRARCGRNRMDIEGDGAMQLRS